MYHTIANYLLAAQSAAVQDVTAVNDGGTITVRNGHFIFTVPFEIPLLSGWGANLTQLNLSCPTWNAINTPQIYPPNLAIVPGNNPNEIDMRSFPLLIPLNEEIVVQSINAAAGTDKELALIHIRPPGGPMNGPQAPQSPIGNLGRVMAQCSVTCAITLGTWSTVSPLVLTNAIKGGTYAVMGLYLVADKTIAYRWTFNRVPFYRGIKLLPGGLTQNLYGNVPSKIGVEPLGVQGYFNTFELPSLQLLGTTAVNSATYNGFIDLIYLGQDMTVDQAIGQIAA